MFFNVFLFCLRGYSDTLTNVNKTSKDKLHLETKTFSMQ